MKLSYRMHTSADRNELVQLWSKETGWDDIDATLWNHRFVHTPFGEAAIALTIDEETNKIIGQVIFMPLVALIDGREVLAYRPYAAFVHKEARSTAAALIPEGIRSFQGLNPFNHPIGRMYNLATDFFRQQGVGLIYMLPDPLWRRLFQFARNFHTASFPLWSLKLPLNQALRLPDHYKSVEIEASDPRLNELWEKSAKLYDCSVVRNSKALMWKTSHFKYFYRGVERGGELVGFADIMYKQRDRQLLICDLLAVDDEALRATIVAAVNFTHEYRLGNPAEPLDKTAVLTTELMQPIVSDLGFYKDKYNFLLVIQKLDSALSDEQIAPSRWYASAND